MMCRLHSRSRDGVAAGDSQQKGCRLGKEEDDAPLESGYCEWVSERRFGFRQLPTARRRSRSRGYGGRWHGWLVRRPCSRAEASTSGPMGRREMSEIGPKKSLSFFFSGHWRGVCFPAVLAAAVVFEIKGRRVGWQKKNRISRARTTGSLGSDDRRQDAHSATRAHQSIALQRVVLSPIMTPKRWGQAREEGASRITGNHRRVTGLVRCTSQLTRFRVSSPRSRQSKVLLTANQ
jgi:hypothetical protein